MSKYRNDTEGFVDCVIPANSPYFVFAYKRSTGMAHRFFPRDQVRPAADWMRHMAHSTDIYIAVAGYSQPTRRIADNVHSIQCFFVDADIKREGDGKDPTKVYADWNEVSTWLERLVDTGGPRPSFIVGSGYGVHIYWLFDPPMERIEWLHYAQGFKNLLIHSGAKGDIGISGDIARILRPPGSFNHKVPEHPVECQSLIPTECRAFIASPKYQVMFPSLITLTGKG